MKGIVYGFGKFSANTSHFNQIVDASRVYTLQSTELTQQLATFLWTQSGNLFQLRRSSRFRPALSVAGDRETMRLIPYLLYQ